MLVTLLMAMTTAVVPGSALKLKAVHVPTLNIQGQTNSQLADFTEHVSRIYHAHIFALDYDITIYIEN